MSKRIAVLTTAFMLGAVISGVVEAAVEVFVFGQFDRKFRDAPRVAFEVAIYGTAAISVIGGVVVGIVTVLLRRRLTVSDQLVGPFFLFGVAYPFMVMAIVQLAGGIGVVLGWIFMIAAPALFVYAAIIRKGSHAV